jgi:hypothetical protein
MPQRWLRNRRGEIETNWTKGLHWKGAIHERGVGGSGNQGASGHVNPDGRCGHRQLHRL